MQKRTTVKTQPIRLRGKFFLPKRSTVITDAPKSKKNFENTRQRFSTIVQGENFGTRVCITIESFEGEKKFCVKQATVITGPPKGDKIMCKQLTVIIGPFQKDKKIAKLVLPLKQSFTK